MKKMCCILTLMCLFVFPLSINAAEVSVSIECDKTVVSPGDTILCTVKGTATDGEIEGVEATINNSSNLTREKIEVDNSIWKNLGDDPNLALVTSTYKSGTFEIAKVTFKVADDVASGTTLSVSSVKNNFVFGYTKEEVKATDVTKEIKVISSDNTLSNLSISSGTLSPAFNKDTLNYSATVDIDGIIISATPTDSNATVTGDVGSKSLVYGLNTFKIYVKSESGETKTYTLSITRPKPADTRDKDNTISSLTVDNKAIELKSDVNEYTYQVDYDVTKVTVKAILNSSKATFLDNSGTQSVTLKEGDNKVEIKVKAENDEVRVYVITINRKSEVVTEPDDNTENKDNSIVDDKKEENINENPKTGSSIIYIVIILVIISVPISIFAYKKYKKREV